MSSPNYLNVKLWSVDQVSSWIRGLGDCLNQYLKVFEENSIDGCKLLMLTNSDLINMGVNKLSLQEIVLQGAALLQNSTYEMSCETLKTCASRLEVACRNLVGLIKKTLSLQSNQGFDSVFKSKSDIFSSIENVLKQIFSMISWINRLDLEEHEERKQSLVLSAKLLGSYTKKKISESLLSNICQQLIEMCEEVIIDFSDVIASQPSWFDVVQLLRDGNQKLGLEIRCSYAGIPYVASVEENSPSSSKKIRAGDEIIQIDEQNVLGWDVKILKEFIESKDGKVRFTLRKKPTLSYMTPNSNRKETKKNEAKLKKKNIELLDGSVSDDELLCKNLKEEENFFIIKSFDDFDVPDVPRLFLSSQEGAPDSAEKVQKFYTPDGEALAPSNGGGLKVPSSSDHLSSSSLPWPSHDIKNNHNLLNSSFDRSYSKSFHHFLTKKKNQVYSSCESLLNNNNSSQYSNILRKSKSSKASKRISCQDLGGTDCQGWLWVKTEGKGRFSSLEKWMILWIVLKSRNISFLKEPQDALPMKSFNLLKCNFSPQKKTQNKFSFKVWNDSETFLFASDRREDMLKWMNKMALASLEDLNAEDVHTIGGFQQFKKKQNQLEEINESDPLEVPEDLKRLYLEMKRADLRLDGRNEMQRRSAILTASTSLKGQKNMDVLKLLSLNRNLKDKAVKLEAIENFLRQAPVTPGALKDFQLQNPFCILEAAVDHEITESDV